MPRYVAFLRGVMPTNCKMPALRQAFEAAGFTSVKTVLGSGNVVFDARAAAEARLEERATAAMVATLGRSFPVIVRPVTELEALVADDPFAGLDVPPGAKRVVTFLRVAPARRPALPPPTDGATLHAVRGRVALTSYLPSPKGPVFMTLIGKTFGDDVTTRTWDTLLKCVRA